MIRKNGLKIVLIVVLVAVVIVAAHFLFIRQSDSEDEVVIKPEGEGDLVFTEEDVLTETAEKPSVPAPSLVSAVAYDENFPEGAREIMAEKIANARKELIKDPMQYEKWIELGNYYKIVNDYQKAVEAWEYAGILSPYNAISFHNLGDVYGYYLKEHKKAEENFLKSIENAPSDPFYYLQTYRFYRDVLEDNEKALDIVKRGLEKDPDNEDLNKALDSLL